MHTGLTNGKTVEETAYEALIQRYQSPIFNLVGRLLDDPSEAVDATLEVFRKVFRNAETFHRETALKISIYRMTVEEARHRRQWFPRRRPENPHPIDRALSAMNRKVRAALVLREIEGLSDEEIAAILDTSVSAVRSRILRGRDALKDHLLAQSRGWDRRSDRRKSRYEKPSSCLP